MTHLPLSRRAVIEAINQFTDKHHAAEYGQAHIVLGDLNLDDGSIEACMAELTATLIFLRWPYFIPEEVREPEEDDEELAD